MENTATMNATTKRAKTKKNSQGREIWERLRHRPIAVAAMAGCALILFMAIFADLLVPYEMAIKNSSTEVLLPPLSAGHLLGTDNFGRDIFARVVHGARTALEIGLLSSLASLVAATILACVCAMKGGWVDNIIMRIVDVISCIPGTVVALAICASLSNGIPQLLLALAISGIPMHTKMIRSMALSVSKKEYIESAVALGGKPGYIMFRHMCPNLASVMIINGTTQVSVNIMQGAALGFIGLGVKAPTPEWGTMLSDGLTFFSHSHMVLIPGLMLCFAALCINTFGDCLRDAFDPQLKGKA